ncbi:VTT domain-containing protein [uncultured Reyranella sp.]|uniref:VTT domain-containing protein n=1 Tax=uncultured Reyranella sp. TaxID=735512 RepID=UPI0025FB4925|nr:VTT domain-containing protein [uncultured Reyranella sp.]
MSLLFQPGRTVWRVEHAARAAVLIDGAAFFAAVREAFLQARRTIFIVGWDIDSRTELVGDHPPTDGFPTNLAAFLTELTRRRPELQIHLLLWDYSLVYAHEREPLPRLSLNWQMPPQVTFCLDSTVPFGSSQHQKLVVVDDALAFSGGLDLTIRRWDTNRHEPDNKRRVDHSGEPYRPFHDVQMMVDSEAARSLALLARARWCHANGGEPEARPEGQPWPESVKPDFTNVDIAIARTQPRYHREEEVREAEALFVDSIARAERTIYIENQFMTSGLVAAALARRLRERAGLEIVMVAPRSHDSFVERRTMRNGRIRFWRTVKAAGGDRVRLLFPSIEKNGRSTYTMVHSKIMVVDDWLLRVGSANLNNRSMGADTECDLAIEASTDRERVAITTLRNRLLGEHCGASGEEVAAAIARLGSLVRVADQLCGNGHCLSPIDDGQPDRTIFARLAERIADPARPLRLGRLAGRLLPRLLFHGSRTVGRRLAKRADRRAAGQAHVGSPPKPAKGGESEQGLLGRTGLVVGGALALIAVLTLAWQFTGLKELAQPDHIRELLEGAEGEPWALGVVVALFVVGGAVAFPVTILILATAAVFGPWWGMLYASAGVAASAGIMFAAGARFGQEVLRRLLGQRWDRLRDRLQRRGLLAVVALRVIPVAPFSLINLAAGAGSIRFVDFGLGTLIGMGPGLVAIALMGDRIAKVLADPSASQLGVLALCVAGWIGLSFGAQAIVSRFGERAS